MSAPRHDFPPVEPAEAGERGAGGAGGAAGDAEAAPPGRFTPGFVAFLGAMLLPAVLALAVYLGAWAVADEVYAAEAAVAGGSSAGAEVGSAVSADSADRADVAGWKQTLVGICPIH